MALLVDSVRHKPPPTPIGAAPNVCATDAACSLTPPPSTTSCAARSSLLHTTAHFTTAISTSRSLFHCRRALPAPPNRSSTSTRSMSWPAPRCTRAITASGARRDRDRPDRERRRKTPRTTTRPSFNSPRAVMTSRRWQVNYESAVTEKKRCTAHARPRAGSDCAGCVGPNAAA